MAVKKLPPIGQGCKPHKVFLDIAHSKEACTCQEHFWLYLNVCLGCGDKFHAYRPDKKTCSDKCRKRLSRSRQDTFFQTVLMYANGVSL